MDESEVIKQAMDIIPEATRIYMNKMADITERIEFLIANKKMDKDAILTILPHDWDVRPYNFTLRELTALEDLFQDRIITISKPYYFD